jgi:hypothetical protein
MATNHSRRLYRLEEIHTPNGPERWHQVIGHSEAELDGRMNEMTHLVRQNPRMGLFGVSLSRPERGKQNLFPRNRLCPHLQQVRVGPIRDIGVTLIKKPGRCRGLSLFALNAAAVVRGCGRSPALWRRTARRLLARAQYR